MGYKKPPEQAVVNIRAAAVIAVSIQAEIQHLTPEMIAEGYWTLRAGEAAIRRLRDAGYKIGPPDPK